MYFVRYPKQLHCNCQEQRDNAAMFVTDITLGNFILSCLFFLFLQPHSFNRNFKTPLHTTPPKPQVHMLHIPYEIYFFPNVLLIVSKTGKKHTSFTRREENKSASK